MSESPSKEICGCGHPLFAHRDYAGMCGYCKEECQNFHVVVAVPVMSDNDICKCGHKRKDHIDEEGYCIAGGLCPCKVFTLKGEAMPKNRISIDNVWYVREDSIQKVEGECLKIRKVMPSYSVNRNELIISLERVGGGMPITRFKPDEAVKILRNE